MQELTISNNVLTFRNQNFNISGAGKADDGFVIITDRGTIRFFFGDTKINGTLISNFAGVGLNEIILTSPRWAAMSNALLNSGAILTKMRTASGMGQFFTLVFAVIQNGQNGFAAESDLQTLLNLGGWGFTNPEKTQINNYFSNHDFNISIS